MQAHPKIFKSGTMIANIQICFKCMHVFRSVAVTQSVPSFKKYHAVDYFPLRPPCMQKNDINVEIFWTKAAMH